VHPDLGLVYLEHLTSADRQLLAEVDAGDVGNDPAAIVGLLSHPRTHAAVFGPERAGEQFHHASPFLTFAVAVHRAGTELAAATFTDEWVGPRQRVPVFDVDVLRDFVGDPLRRLFLIELLASYTHVASGSTWVRTRRGWKRRRFSELDPVRLAGLLEVVSQEERPGVYRRLGDCALFLTGVFPDHTATRALPPLQYARLLRMGVGGEDDGAPGRASGVAELGAVGLLEQLGRRWYELAAGSAGAPLTATMQATAEVGRRFREARRILNYVTDRFLFPHRSSWFGMA
jgi:hypothetical protein